MIFKSGKESKKKNYSSISFISTLLLGQMSDVRCTPTYKFISNVNFGDAPYTLREHEKMYYSYNEDFGGDKAGFFSWSQNGLRD